MRNADHPAFSQSFASNKDGNMYSAYEKSDINGGLTKREYFAGLAMQALMFRKRFLNQAQGVTVAVAWADQLLKELEKPSNHE
jgi:hypothetical protein